MDSLRGLSRIAAGAVIMTAWAVPACAQAQLIDYMRANSQWAIGSVGNCYVPRTAYNLELSDSFMIWRNGVGSLDVEEIVATTDSMVRTATTSSTGQKRGQIWVYSRLGERINVQPANKNPFILVRCP
jgi:hypothetical protein